MSEKVAGSERRETFEEVFDAALNVVFDDKLIPTEDRKVGYWQGRYTFQLGAAGEVECATIDWQAFIKGVRLSQETGPYAAPLAKAALYRYTLDVQDGTLEREVFAGPYLDIVEEANDRDSLYEINISSLFNAVLELPLDGDQLGVVAQKHYATRDELGRRHELRRSQNSVPNKLFARIGQQDDASRRATLEKVAQSVHSSPFGQKYTYQLNQQIISYVLGKQTHDGEPYEPFSDFTTFMHDMQELELQQTDPYITPEVMSFPGVAEFLLTESRKGINIFHEVKETERLTFAQRYLYKVFDALQYTEGRDSKRIGIIRDVLFPTDHKTRVEWNRVILLANQITTRVNETLELPDEPQKLLAQTGDSRDLLFLGEAVFRILEITSTSNTQTEENRYYTELLDELLEPVYKNFGQPTYISEVDIKARYPLASQQERMRLAQEADKGGYKAASSLYATYRREYGSRVYFDRNTPGRGIIS